MGNSDNPKIGKNFEDLARELLSKHYGKVFVCQKSLPIGNPSKLHRFDFVSDDNLIIVECKCYTWTGSGNLPSAKIGFINEAVFYMSYLPNSLTKIIVLKKSNRIKNSESLAQYYIRINGHLLEGIKIIEVDMEQRSLSFLKE